MALLLLSIMQFAITPSFFILFQAQKAQKLTQSFYSASSATLAIQDGKEAGQTIEQVQLQLECVQLQANSMCVKYHLSTLNLRCRTPSFSIWGSEIRQHLEARISKSHMTWTNLYMYIYKMSSPAPRPSGCACGIKSIAR